MQAARDREQIQSHRKGKGEEMADVIEGAAAAVATLEAAHAKYAEVIASITKNPRINEDARRADLSAESMLFEKIAGLLKEQALAQVDQAAEAVEDEQADLIDAARVRPRDAAQWTSAAAQNLFIAEDVSALIEGGQSSEIAAQFRRAMKRGGVATAYLIARHGERELSKRAKNPGNPQGTERERMALEALRAAVAEDEKPDAAKMRSVADHKQHVVHHVADHKQHVVHLRGRVMKLYSPGE